MAVDQRLTSWRAHHHRVVVVGERGDRQRLDQGQSLQALSDNVLLWWVWTCLLEMCGSSQVRHAPPASLERERPPVLLAPHHVVRVVLGPRLGPVRTEGPPPVPGRRHGVLLHLGRDRAGDVGHGEVGGVVVVGRQVSQARHGLGLLVQGSELGLQLIPEIEEIPGPT